MYVNIMYCYHQMYLFTVTGFLFFFFHLFNGLQVYIYCRLDLFFSAGALAFATSAVSGTGDMSAFCTNKWSNK